MQQLLTCLCIYVNEVALSLDSVIFLKVNVTLCVFLVLFGIVAISLFRCFTMRYITLYVTTTLITHHCNRAAVKFQIQMMLVILASM